MEKQTAEQIAAKATEKAEKAMTKRRTDLAKHKHAIVETLTFDENAGNGGKYKVQIRCTECQNEERWVYTSDLFQVSTCTACSALKAKQKKADKREEIKAARALIKANKTEVVPA